MFAEESNAALAKEVPDVSAVAPDGRQVWVGSGLLRSGGELEARVSAPAGTFRFTARSRNGFEAEAELEMCGPGESLPPLRLRLDRRHP